MLKLRELKPKKGYNFILTNDEEITPSGIYIAIGGNSPYVRNIYKPIGRVVEGQYKGQEVVFNRQMSSPIMLLDAQNRPVEALSVEDRDVIAILERV
jgi:hypothetical protein